MLINAHVCTHMYMYVQCYACVYVHVHVCVYLCVQCTCTLYMYSIYLSSCGDIGLSSRTAERGEGAGETVVQCRGVLRYHGVVVLILHSRQRGVVTHQKLLLSCSWAVLRTVL